MFSGQLPYTLSWPGLLKQKRKSELLKTEKLLLEILMKKGFSLSTAESCTGGLISARITSLPGSSKFFRGSVIAYDNMVKQKLLSVSPETLQASGAVSGEVVEQMATGVSTLMETDCSVSVSGIAGPGGGTQSKPVGLVYIGSFVCDSVISRKYLFNGNREDIRVGATEAALNQLINQISEL